MRNPTYKAAWLVERVTVMGANLCSASYFVQTPGMLLNFINPQFLHLQNWDNNIYLIGTGKQPKTQGWWYSGGTVCQQKAWVPQVSSHHLSNCNWNPPNPTMGHQEPEYKSHVSGLRVKGEIPVYYQRCAGGWSGGAWFPDVPSSNVECTSPK